MLTCKEYYDKTMAKIIIPNKLNIDTISYRFLSKLQYDICFCTDTDIELDFSECRFTHPAFTAYFGTLISLGEVWHKKVRLSAGSNERIWNYFLRSGIYDYYSDTNSGKINQNSIPFTKISLDEDEIVPYIDNILHLAPISLSEDCRMMLFKNIYEIFINAVDHSQANNGVFSCGHWMPNKRQLIFSVCDTGIGIPCLVKQRIPDIDPVAAITWALQRGNSTMQLASGVPRGVGLSDLRDFTRINNGSLIIFSNNVYYNCSDNEVKIPMRYQIVGTLITIVITADDEHIYILKEERT